MTCLSRIALLKASAEAVPVVPPTAPPGRLADRFSLAGLLRPGQLQEPLPSRTGRKARGWRQAELADALTRPGAKVTQQDISHFETGRREPPDSLKPLLIGALGIDPRDVAPDWVRPLLSRAA